MIRDPLTDGFLVDHVLRQHATRQPAKIALVEGERRLTYAELDASADQWAVLLAGMGVTRGDRVLLALNNSVEVVAGFYGALRADAIPSIVGADRRIRCLVPIVERAEPRVIVTTAAVAGALRASSAIPTSMLLVDGDAPDGCESLRSALGAIPVPAVPPKRRSIELDLATICWTSGSTGEPKGVMLTHHNLRNSAAAIAGYLEQDERDVVLCALPLSHSYGLFQVLVTLGAGGTLAIERGFTLVYPLVKRLAELRVTGFAGVPTIFASMLALKGLDKVDLSNLRYLTNAACALPNPLLLRLREVLPAVRLFSMYGQTECTRVSYLPPELGLARPSSVGIAMPNEELWIEREDGTRAGPGEVGELVVRGPNVMRGYWRDSQATARALRPGEIPGELVLHTGDLFRADQDGYLYFVARLDEVIKTRGEKVAPWEVEQAILKLTGVIEVAVVGIPHPIHGAAVKAVVAKGADACITVDDIKRVVLTEVGEIAVPSMIEFVDSLPKTACGKSSKSELV